MPNGLLNVFTGPQNPLLAASENEAARRQALVNAGLQIMLATGRGESPLAAIALGGQAGQQAGGAAQVQALQRGTQERIRGLVEQGAPLEDLFREAIASGNPEMFRSLAGVLAALQGGTAQRPRYQFVTLSKDGEPVKYQVNVDTGEMREIGKEFRYVNPYRTPTQYVDPVTGEARLGMFNVYTGEMTPIEDVAPMVAGTETERKAQAFAGFIPDHVRYIDNFERAPGRIEQALSDRGLGELTSAETQRLKLAGAALSEAWLRLTTGAAYNEREFQTAFEMFTPRPGDKRETLDAKRENRKRLVDMLNTISKRLRPAAGSLPDGTPVPGMLGRFNQVLGEK